jgi:hypothetical protein
MVGRTGPYKAIGWHVELYSLAAGALRYCRAERQLTLLCESVDETDKLGRKWLFFPTLRVVVYVPESLTWDDGSPIEALDAPNVMRDLEDALAKAGELYRIEFSDEVYRRAEQDWATLGADPA